jgi:hypothetical protein
MAELFSTELKGSLNRFLTNLDKARLKRKIQYLNTGFNEPHQQENENEEQKEVKPNVSEFVGQTQINVEIEIPDLPTIHLNPQEEKRVKTTKGRTIKSETIIKKIKRNPVHVAYQLQEKDYIKPIVKTILTYTNLKGKTQDVMLVELNLVDSAKNELLNRVYVKGTSLGTLFTSKSNISRLFGQFESPSEKILAAVTSIKNYRNGQECNMLTYAGVKRFGEFMLSKSSDHIDYAGWIYSTLLPRMKELEMAHYCTRKTIEHSSSSLFFLNKFAFL